MAKRALHAVGAFMLAALLTAIFATTGAARMEWPGASFLEPGGAITAR